MTTLTHFHIKVHLLFHNKSVFFAKRLDTRQWREILRNIIHRLRQREAVANTVRILVDMIDLFVVFLVDSDAADFVLFVTIAAIAHSPHPFIAFPMRQTSKATHNRIAIAQRRNERSARLEKKTDIAEKVANHRLGKRRKRMLPPIRTCSEAQTDN